jgi:hypothetical protein
MAIGVQGCRLHLITLVGWMKAEAEVQVFPSLPFSCVVHSDADRSVRKELRMSMGSICGVVGEVPQRHSFLIICPGEQRFS